MKISGTKPGATSKLGGSNKAKGSAKSGSKKEADKAESLIGAFGADELEVSDSGAAVDLIRNLVAESPDIRVGEVQRIVDQLKSGKFKINFAKVADGFLKEVILTEIARKAQRK